MIAPALQTREHWQLERIQVWFDSQISEAAVLGCPGRFHDPRTAEALIEAGAMDMVGGTRGFFADPFLARRRARAGSPDIRPCIGLNMCLTEAGCVMNPAKGREAELGEGTLVPATTPRRIVIVGGGPAGAGSSACRRTRGHSVVLFDAQEALGGGLHLMKHVPGRENVVEAAAWWDHQLTEPRGRRAPRHLGDSGARPRGAPGRDRRRHRRRLRRLGRDRLRERTRPRMGPLDGPHSNRRARRVVRGVDAPARPWSSTSSVRQCPRASPWRSAAGVHPSTGSAAIRPSDTTCRACSGRRSGARCSGTR